MHKEDVYATSIFVWNCSIHAVCLAIAASPRAQTIWMTSVTILPSACKTLASSRLDMKDKEAAEAALKGQGLGLAKAVRKSLEAKTDEL